MQNNMKTAICISGAPRFVKEGHALLSKYLVGFEDMDIFVHTWSQSEKVHMKTLQEMMPLYLYVKHTILQIW